jgi:hypothetical protein
MSNNFIYAKLQIKLTSEQLGTATAASIYAEHVLKTAQKQIKQANRLSGKVTKAFQKYKGTNPITDIKEMAELKAIIRSYQEVLGKVERLPRDVEGLLEYSKKCEEEFEALVKEGKEQKATIFLKSEDGKPILSSHMIIGNLKENAKISTNNSTLDVSAKAFKSKVSIQEMLALDVSPVEPFMYPDQDIIRGRGGKPKLCERPITFERMGKRETAIALSEQLPIGTEYSVTLRIREDSPFAEKNLKVLRTLLNLGKSNGLGQWRGSGNKGQYVYKLDVVPEPKRNKQFEGWN